MNAVVLIDPTFRSRRLLFVSLLDQQVLQAFLCPNGPAVAAYQTGRQINGRATRTSDDSAIIDIVLVDHRSGQREALLELLSQGEMQRASPAIKQPSLAQHERTGAQRYDRNVGSMHIP
ncbi:hypothetical protein D3C76_1571780 [compost metagenome]